MFSINLIFSLYWFLPFAAVNVFGFYTNSFSFVQLKHRVNDAWDVKLVLPECWILWSPSFLKKIFVEIVGVTSFMILFKEVPHNCIAHRSVHIFIMATSSHSHIKRKKTKRIFLQYSCSVTMINIAKKYLWQKIHELNTLIGSSDDS